MRAVAVTACASAGSALPRPELVSAFVRACGRNGAGHSEKPGTSAGAGGTGLKKLGGTRKRWWDSRYRDGRGWWVSCVWGLSECFAATIVRPAMTRKATIGAAT